MDQRKNMKQQVKDEIHEYHHHLALNEKPWDRRRRTYCVVCNDLLSGEFYSCADCTMHFHKTCAEAPLQIDHLHLGHLQPLTFEYGPAVFRSCAMCSKKRSLAWYVCSSCSIMIDLQCAFLTLNHGGEILHGSHSHPLLFVENHSNELERNCCSVCHCELFGCLYVCTTCEFYIVHNSCIDGLPVEISHPCHRLASLSLDQNENGTSYCCELCGSGSRGYSYGCSSCNFQIHPHCAWPSLVVEDKSHHEHPFNLLWKQDQFICNACGTEGKHVSYICLTCNLQVHKSCTSLPRFLKSIRHRHPLAHIYFLQNMGHGMQNCRICYEEVNAKHGSYSCLKQDCNYVVHVKCATGDGNYCYEVNSDEVKDLLEEHKDSSITRVIEVNESGEAVKIEHFLHEHHLMLEHKIKDGDHDKQCDGCTESISTSFYYCSQSQCNFLLHKSCAELPRTWDGWLAAYRFTLKSDGIFKCLSCNHRSNGFSYYSEDDYVQICLRCAKISDTFDFEYSGQKHFLFYDVHYTGNCTGCGSYRKSGGHRSKRGDVALDPRCMTLPQAVRHKCDKHVLSLTYKDETEDSTQQCCDICEEEKDPNHWFYQCSICDNSAHIECVLGEYPCFKVRSKYEDKDHHEHPLTFVRKIYYYPKCSNCGERCLDLSLECTTCDYIVHWKCIPPKVHTYHFDV